MTKVQQYLENKYPVYIRENIKWINITNLNLEGELDLKEFISLETLWCSYNSLTKLLSLENTNLKSLRCCNNQITNLDFNFLLELEDLDCDNNPLGYSNLDVARTKKVNLLKTKLLLESKKKNNNLAKRNGILKEKAEKSSQTLDRLLEIVSELPNKAIIKNNPAQREITIVQPESDEKQIELEIEIDNTLEIEKEEVVSPTTQSALERLKNLRKNYDNIQTSPLNTKQAHRQFQILVPPKK